MSLPHRGIPKETTALHNDRFFQEKAKQNK